MPQKGNLVGKNLGKKFGKSSTEFEITTLKFGWVPIFMENGALLIFGPNLPKIGTNTAHPQIWLGTKICPKMVKMCPKRVI